MRIIRSSDYATMPWKNGGGTTTEIAVFPPGADMATFEWRLSMARVERGGPFSLFPGVDRSIAILEGDGLTLAVEDEDDVCLDKALSPFPFPGDAAAGVEMVGGPVLDLNLMTRRDRWRHALVRTVAPAGPGSVERAGEFAAVIARGCALALKRGDACLEAADGDTLLLDATDPPKVAIEVAGSGQLYIAQIWRR